MDAIVEGFSLLLKIENIILITLGVLIGVLVGSAPWAQLADGYRPLNSVHTPTRANSSYRHDGRVVLCGDFRWIYYRDPD